MSFNVIVTEPFERKAKRLAKKHKSLPKDLNKLFNELTINPRLGINLGNNCFKIRFAISSKGKGKSSGGRIITFVRINNNSVYLMDIYDKSEQSTISDSDIKKLIDLLAF